MSFVCTVDVEDWAQSTIDTNLPITGRSGQNMEYLLDLLAVEDVKVTCFILGKFAEKFPECVKRIATEGHEIASHGYGHVDLFRLSSAEFREDVQRSKGQLEELTGVQVKGYRAPCFSLIMESLWALDVLAEEGFVYDASINPGLMARCGLSNWPPQPVKVKLHSGLTLVELPLATLPLLGLRFPVAGGGYHRLLPWPFIRYAVEKTLTTGEAFVAYCHPYEFDPDEFSHLSYPLPLKTRLYQGLGRKGFEAKFIKMLQEFKPDLAIYLAEQVNLQAYTPFL